LDFNEIITFNKEFYKDCAYLAFENQQVEIYSSFLDKK
jgi:hypothetical protein